MGGMRATAGAVAWVRRLGGGVVAMPGLLSRRLTGGC